MKKILTGFQIKKKVKYLSITMSNVNDMLFQHNYITVWNEIKKNLLR